MKEILFATTNISKGKRFIEGLLKNDIKLLTLKDINIKLDIEENGATAIENARIKAHALFKLTNKPSMGMDDTLYLEGVPKDKQPGLFVRRVNGKELNDNEMIEHYLLLVNKYGINGRLNAKWIYVLVVINENGQEFDYSWENDSIYMVNEVSDIINPGYPLNSITKFKNIDKFLTDATKEDKVNINNNEKDVVKFIVKSLK